MGVNAPTFALAYISYSKDMLPAHMNCEHVFQIQLKPFFLADHPEVTGVLPTGNYKCLDCGWVRPEDWVMAWSLGLV